MRSWLIFCDKVRANTATPHGGRQVSLRRENERAERLMREGLDRHEAIHAVGSVLVDFVQALNPLPYRDLSLAE